MGSFFVFIAILITNPVRAINICQSKQAAVQNQLQIEFLPDMTDSAYDATYGYGHHMDADQQH